jgi:hypothetical protein
MRRLFYTEFKLLSNKNSSQEHFLFSANYNPAPTVFPDPLQDSLIGSELSEETGKHSVGNLALA